MVIVFENTKDQYSMDGYLHTALTTGKAVIRKDFDMVFCVDGGEGSGKSVITQQIAKYCDPTLTLDRIVFTPRDFRKAIVNAKQYQAIIYDEAYTGLSSRASMSMINRALVSMLAEIRQKNLFVFVVMPCFMDLDKYVALWRSRALIHVYLGNNFQRGFFSFYNVDRKKGLYIKGKKFYSYNTPNPNFRGRFPDHYTVDVKEYKKKKKSSLMDREKAAEQKELKKEIQDEIFTRMMLLPEKYAEKIPNYVKAKILGISEVHYYRKIKQFDEMREM